MESRRERRKHIRKHVDRKLIFRWRLFWTISLALLLFCVISAIVQHISLLIVIIGLLIGLAVGSLIGSLSRITWDHGAGKVMSRLDILSICALVISAIFEIFKERLFGEFVQGASVSLISYAAVAGVLMGRALMLRKNVRRVLRSVGLLKDSKGKE